MYLCEVYVMFKTIYPGSEIGFTVFTKLRPKNALLLKNQPMDLCKCSLHENSHLKLEARRITFDTTFLSKVLCCSETYNSQYWKGECDECTDGNIISFPDILDNEDVTCKEWR